MSNYLIPEDELLRDFYDPQDPSSILRYAKLLLGQELRPYLTSDQAHHAISNEGKGDFGNLLEATYFKVKNNSESRPDIPESGVEIKSGQIKLVRKTTRVLKERLKVSMIDYNKSFTAHDLLTSSLWTKLEKILLLLFLKSDTLPRIDEECVYSDILSWSPDDIRQMSEDWAHIKDLVVNGKADKLSEGQTWYLGACTAGANSTSLRDAPGGIRVKARAFSLKAPYLNFKLGYSSGMKGPKALLIPSKGQTLDEFILHNMASFFGRPIDQIAVSIGRPELSNSFAKNIKSKIARALLEEVAGKHTSDISTDFEQFRKAGVIEKTIVLESSGVLVESISFPAFKWIELDAEIEWEDSELYSMLTTKFFFTVFQKSTTTMPILIGSFFWTMPTSDLDAMREVWLDTKQKIRTGDYEDFIRKTQHPVGHVRPHARDSSDTYRTPQGTYRTKKSFWLNNDYVRRIAIDALHL